MIERSITFGSFPGPRRTRVIRTLVHLGLMLNCVLKFLILVVVSMRYWLGRCLPLGFVEDNRLRKTVSGETPSACARRTSLIFDQCAAARISPERIILC